MGNSVPMSCSDPSTVELSKVEREDDGEGVSGKRGDAAGVNLVSGCYGDYGGESHAFCPSG